MGDLTPFLPTLKNKIFTVKNIDFLRNLTQTFINLPDGAMAITEGFYVATPHGDGGGASYIYRAREQSCNANNYSSFGARKPKTPPDKECSENVLGVWHLIVTDPLNAKQLGVKSYSTVPSNLESFTNGERATNAINFAILHHKRLYFPSGIYYFKQLTLPVNTTHFTLFGDRRVANPNIESNLFSNILNRLNTGTLFIMTAAALDSFIIHDGAKEINMHNLTIIGETNKYIINAQNCNQCQFKSISIRNRNVAGYGWNATGSTNSIYAQVVVTTGISLDNLSPIVNYTNIGFNMSDICTNNYMTRLLIEGFNLGFKLGNVSDNPLQTVLSQNNTMTNTISQRCYIGCTIGNKWSTSSFINCQFRGFLKPIGLGSDAETLYFGGCGFDVQDDIKSVVGDSIHIGYSKDPTLINYKKVSNVTFNNCQIQNNKKGKPLLLWDISNGVETKNITFNSCEFDNGPSLSDKVKFIPEFGFPNPYNTIGGIQYPRILKPIFNQSSQSVSSVPVRSSSNVTVFATTTTTDPIKIIYTVNGVQPRRVIYLTVTWNTLSNNSFSSDTGTVVTRQNFKVTEDSGITQISPTENNYTYKNFALITCELIFTVNSDKIDISVKHGTSVLTQTISWTLKIDTTFVLP